MHIRNLGRSLFGAIYEYIFSIIKSQFKYNIYLLSSQTVYKKKTFWVNGLSDMIRFKEFGKIINPKNIKVVLTVAHLDHDADNHDVSLDRLKAMCQYCHLNYDAKMKWEKANRINQ